MSSLNTFIFDGNLTRNPELRYTPGGTAVATYTVAVSKRVRSGDGWADAADFIPVVVYGPQAERDAKLLAKGAGVVVQASVHSWFDRAAKKGGFNFVAQIVRYKGSGSTPTTDAAPAGCDGPAGAGTDGGADWLRDYDQADAHQGARATPPSAALPAARVAQAAGGR